jgi:SAM-dependent methyltransferase
VSDGDPGAWDGDRYQARIDALAATGRSMHGEADLVCRLGPATVLDAGCGTGRVAVELARRAIEVVGVDVDASMLETARRRAPSLTWVQADLGEMSLGRTFDVVVMAGNVPLFTPAGTQAEVVEGCARHLAPGGVLVSGFSLGRGYEVDDLDGHCRAAGLVVARRWSTWARDPFGDDADYAVSLHRRPG